MVRETKEMLIKERSSLLNKITELENQVKLLEKQNMELKVRLEILENLPKQCADTIGGCVDWLTKTVFTQQQGQQNGKVS